MQTDTVRGRFEYASSSLTPTQMDLGLAVVAALGFTLLFVQEPMMNDALHNFRHGAGITCH
jgi:hypothetical protein